MPKLKEAQKLRGELSKQADKALSLAKSADALEGSPELQNILELDCGELQKLRERLLEKYFSNSPAKDRFRCLDTEPLTERELEDFCWNVWRNVELMRSDMSGMSAEAQEEFLNTCYQSIQFGFESHYEQSQRQTERAKKRHAPDRKAKERALLLANEFREMKPTERIGECAYYVAVSLRDEGFGEYTDKAIRGWITELFPAELRRSGRPPKE
mgnify:FL=1